MPLRMIEAIGQEIDIEAWEKLVGPHQTLGAWREELSDGLSLMRVLVRSERTENLVHEIENIFGTSPDFRLMIFEVEASLPPVEEPEPEPEPETEKEKKPAREPARIACAELVEKLSDGATVNRVFIWTVILSTVVAAVGLLKDNVAIIIGAMVIAPLLAPNMTLSLGTTLGDLKLIRGALVVNFAGLGLALALSIAIGWMFPVDPAVGEIQSRLSVGLSDVILALAAGSAGALALTTGISSALVGVMVAVALLPPLATTGMMIGSGNWQLAAGAFLLTATNVVCINIAGVATFLFQNVRPRHWWEAERSSKMIRNAAAIWSVLLALVVLLIYLASRGNAPITP